VFLKMILCHTLVNIVILCIYGTYSNPQNAHVLLVHRRTVRLTKLSKMCLQESRFIFTGTCTYESLRTFEEHK
jgi:hypothetical protein